MIQTFKDEISFSKWVKAFPKGFVANYHIDPPSEGIIIHHSWCPKAAKMHGVESSHTKYIKVCSKDKNELVEWLVQNIRGSIRSCPLCKP